MKVGWGGEPFPESTFPTICGRPLLRYEEQIEGVQLKPLMIGDEAAPLRSMLELSCPVDNGIVRDWDDMKNIWEYAFYKKVLILCIYIYTIYIYIYIDGIII